MLRLKSHGRTFATRVAAGQYVLPDHGKYGKVARPARLEEFEDHPHQNPTRDRDWSSEIRGFYRDLIKSIPTMKQRFRLVIPNDVVRKNIRSRFEQGPKLSDPAALRHRALMISADMEDYFRENFLDHHVQDKYNNMDAKAILKQDLVMATSETQAAHRFFNEGTNILLETGIGTDDVTENRVYMTRENAYKKSIASLRGEAAVDHILPALDPANKVAMQTLASEVDLQSAVDVLANTPVAHDAEEYKRRCESFHAAAGLEYHKPSGGAVQKAWEKFKDDEVNATVLMHPAFQAVMKDPKRNLLVRGMADWVQLTKAGDTVTQRGQVPAPGLLRAAEHLYYSDQLPENWAEDLGISYLADLKGVDRRLDLLLDEEISYREERLLKVQIHTAELMKAAIVAKGDASSVKKQLDDHDWSKFQVEIDGVAF